MAENRLGMWTFLASEVMMFGALFLAYSVSRFLNPEMFVLGSNSLSLTLGTLNTAVLLTSSLTMALAVQGRWVRGWLSLTMLLALVFLGIKAMEYHEHFSQPKTLFLWLYFVMTGLHALHVLIGIGLMGVGLLLPESGRFDTGQEPPAAGRRVWVEISALYWHFVDIVWIFLFPLLYLVGRSG